MTITDFLARATRVLFFTGKGGVGKTSLSCATALALAEQGRRVLLVSTDPASNLDEVLQVKLSDSPTCVAGTDRLFALNIDPVVAASALRERVVGPYRGILPAATVASMEEGLSGACTVEIAAFDQFTRLLGDPAATEGFDHLIFDTAPTGHTMRLLSLPAAWTGFIATNTTGTSCLGPLAGLESRKSLYQASLNALANERTTTLVLVSRPDKAAIAEAERTRGELLSVGMSNQVLVINGAFTATDHEDVAAAALERRCIDALASMPPLLASLPRTVIPLRPRAPMGIRGLRRLFDDDAEAADMPLSVPSHAWPGLGEMVQSLVACGPGLVMTMGKGGVGKTTVASAIAVALADRGYSVHLSTTDPAAHIAVTVDGELAGLRISRIDPHVETQSYTAEVLAEASPSLDAQGVALLQEDLRSPCTEEIAVFRAFADIVASQDTDFVVLDTAPTGHTLLLLDAAEAYHREVTRKLSTGIPDSVRDLLPRLRDEQLTRILLVTTAEATPVHEAERLQDDLRRAGMQPFAWVVNQSFGPDASTDPLLQRKAAGESRFLDEVATKLARRIAVVPWAPAEPVGIERLRELVHSTEAVEVTR